MNGTQIVIVGQKRQVSKSKYLFGWLKFIELRPMLVLGYFLWNLGLIENFIETGKKVYKIGRIPQNVNWKKFNIVTLFIHLF